VHLQDIRYALRLLARSPGFTLLTVVVLAGGLGLSTFTFSFLHTAMIRPLPLSDGDRIVRLSRLEDGRYRPVDVADVAALRASLRTVRDLGGYSKREVMMGRAGETRVVSATVAEPVLFAVARTPARLGRTLLPSDAFPGAEPVVVLSHRTWELAFAASPAAVNQIVPVNGVATRIVGVMPAGFGFPVAEEAWLPLSTTALAATPPGREGVSLFARLAPGATTAQASAEATTQLRHLIAARTPAGSTSAVHTVQVESFPAAQIGEERALLFVLLNAAAGLILLLSLVNVTTLLTARANERLRETAVRMALGASTARLVVQGLWEGVLLCLAGGVVGTAAAAWGLDAITRWTQIHMPGNMAFWWVWQMDAVTLASAGAFVTVAITALGSVVSLRAVRTNVREVMQDGSARAGGRRDGRMARAMVVTQVTSVTILMFVGVLAAIVARQVVTVDPGYDPARLLQVELSPSTDRFATVEARAGVFRDVQTRLAEDRAVAGVLLRTRLAGRDDGATFAVRAADPATAVPPAHVLATLGSVSTLGIAVVQGRLLGDADDRRHPPVAMVSQALAARQWPGRSPIGEQLRLAGGDDQPWRTIVGVVTDLPYGNPLARDRSVDAIYVPLLQTDVEATQVFLRCRSTEIAGRQALHRVLGAIDPEMVPGYVFRASEVIEKTGLITIGLAKLLGACFAFALLLAVAGTYGLMSASIGLRTREIGVRRALGASDAVATWLLLTQGARQLGVGTLIAAPVLVAIGVTATRLLPLGGVLTALAGVAVSAAIVGVVLAATWLPTRRVLRVPLRDAIWKE
jgi:predicted permease